ncbi:MAG: 4Fe-4S binding protein, partial [Alphaproteobacteria bacterium]
HVLIIGETGSGKRRLARLLHSTGERAGLRLLSLDCSSPPPLPARLTEGMSTTERLEAAQQVALFGREGVEVRRGLLELAGDGDLVLEHIDQLAPRIQALLAHYLERQAMPRILATSTTDLPEAARLGDYSPRLLRCFSEPAVHLPPLRDRKQDLTALIDEMLPDLNRKHQRRVTRVDKSALHKLVDYSWPQNQEELRRVLDRAVALCKGETLTAEHLFLHQGDFSSQGRLNLLEWAPLRRLLDRSDPWRLPRRVVTGILTGVMLTLALGGQAAAAANLALWSLLWPGLLLLVVCGARLWCSVCPLHGLAQLVPFKPAALPRRLLHLGPWFGLLGTLAILTAEQIFDMRHNPTATLGLLAVLVFATLGTNALFGRRAWCRSLCPLGRLVGQCARLSLVELHSNPEVCGSQCRVHDCVRDRDCPMGLHPGAVSASDDCVLCLECAHRCPHGSVRLDLRWPWLGLLQQRPREGAAALFGVVIAAACPALSLAGRATTATQSGAAAGVFCGLLLTFLLIHGKRGRSSSLAAAGTAWLPLAGAALLAHESRHFLTAGEALPAALLHLTGLDRWIAPEWVTPELGTLAALPFLGLVAAVGLGWYLLAHMRRQNLLSFAQVLAHRLLQLAAALSILIYG